MNPTSGQGSVVSAGDLDGLGRVYTREGMPILLQGEGIVRVASGWDLNVRSPWRKVLPGVVFSGYNSKAVSQLFITNQRMVLVREIDAWRELKGEYTVLGTPNAVSKELELNEKKRLGARQFCVIRSHSLKSVKSKRFDRPRSLLFTRALGSDGRQYAISIWKTDGVDIETLDLIASNLLSQ